MQDGTVGTFNGSFSSIVYPEDATKHFVGLVFSVSKCWYLLWRRFELTFL